MFCDGMVDCSDKQKETINNGIYTFRHLLDRNC